MPVPVVARLPTLLLIFSYGLSSAAYGAASPETVLRAIVQANADRNLAEMARHMVQDPDVIGYGIGGRKYVGWQDFSRDMSIEFDSVSRLEIPIKDLKVWDRGTVAWFAMELDYIRYVDDGGRMSRRVLELRETGVMEQRNGRWVVVSWHESLRGDSPRLASSVAAVIATSDNSISDLSGEWDIQEEDKTYRATLDRNGNGSYTWQGGRIATTAVSGRSWQGTWHQTGNDREGAFELLLSEDGTEAKGVWWYTRVGDRTNIPPRQWGGSYVWKRLTIAPSPAAAP